MSIESDKQFSCPLKQFGTSESSGRLWGRGEAFLKKERFKPGIKKWIGIMDNESDRNETVKLTWAVSSCMSAWRAYFW